MWSSYDLHKSWFYRVVFNVMGFSRALWDGKTLYNNYIPITYTKMKIWC